jgi:hypothetical protein
MLCLVAEATPVDNIKGGLGERDRKERTHGHKQPNGADTKQ